MIYVIHWFVNILTLGLVSIATITTTTYHVDDPITELNNQSLNDIFLNGNQISNDDWEQSSNVVITIVNNDLVFTSPNVGTSFSRNYLNYDNVPNDKLYFNYILDNQSSGTSQLKYGDSSGGYTILTHSSGLNNYSTIFEYYWGFNGNNDNIYLINYNSNSNDYRVLLNSDMILVNLTDLGIDNLTQAQMDDWYDIFVQANENNGIYIDSTAHLNNNIHLVDVSVMVISFGLWVWLFKFLKGVIF